MTIVVCALRDLSAQIAKTNPARLITLTSPGHEPPAAPTDIPRLTLTFNDISEPREGLTPPSAAMIDQLLAFGSAWIEPGPLLIHCWMGISRSPAAAIILAAALHPERAESDLAGRFRALSPSATPNLLMVSLADEALNRGGRLKDAVAAIGRGQEAGVGEPVHFRVRRRPRGTGDMTDLWKGRGAR
jgi:predicted protein tyrosine phosphatase